jgi:hypothetical protein
MADKKTYKEINGTTRVGDFLRSIGKGNILEKVIGVAGNIATGDILGAVKSILNTNEGLTPEQRDYALKMAELDFREEEEISKRWNSDMMSDSWMSKNIRPYTLAILSGFLMLMVVLDSSLTGFVVGEEWVNTLKSLLWLVYGAYFGSRGLEKITDKIAVIKKKL